ncbi:MAG TPA: DsbA family protein, partial [Acidimicrobiales bacterium]
MITEHDRAEHRSHASTVVEVFADVSCPFTHVGLRRLVDRRRTLGRPDIALRVRAWPLELVNGEPLAPDFVAEEIKELRADVAPDLFQGFRPEIFPSTSVPALALTAAAYRIYPGIGEAVALELRHLLFEDGVDISDPDVLARIADEHSIEVTDDDRASVEADHAEGVRRGVIGSPHFFTAEGDFFCPALDV